MVAAAAVTLPAAGAPVAAAATTTSTTTYPYPTCGAGPEGSAGGVRPLCTRPPTRTTSPTAPTSPTSPSPTTGRSSFDFEDGTTQGWSAADQKIKLVVRKQASHSGALGLAINGLAATLRGGTGPSVTVDDTAFTGAGTYRHVTLFLAVKGAKVNVPRCGVATKPQGPLVTVRARSVGQLVASQTVRLSSTWLSVDLSFPATGAPVTVELLQKPGTAASTVWLDDMSLSRWQAPTPTVSLTLMTTSRPTSSGPALVEPPARRTPCAP